METFWTAYAMAATALVLFACAYLWNRRNKHYAEFMARRDSRERPESWVSWYRSPGRAGIQYLRAWEPDYEGEPAMYYYVPNIDHATRFATEAEALKVTPIYDGSNGIEQRSGVVRVRNTPSIVSVPR